MELKEIPLSELQVHPDNANVMSRDVLGKLKGHIAGHGNYEPLIVRRHPRQGEGYELLNGHHRKLVLEELGYTTASCIVWEVNDEEAMLLLATLNRLTGDDDLRKRAALLEKLTRRYRTATLLAKLPETKERLEKLLELNSAPTPAASARLPALPEAMTFFVVKEQKMKIEKALRVLRDAQAEKGAKQKGGHGPDYKAQRGEGTRPTLTRGDLLAEMAGIFLEAKEGH